MINKNNLEKLEFFKILTSIAKYAITETGKEEVLKLFPLTDFEKIMLEGAYVSEAKEILIHLEQPPINYVSNLYTFLSQSKIERTVIPKNKIREISKLAETSRVLHNFLNASEISNKISANLLRDLFVDKQFETRIKKIFTQNGDIADSASSKLTSIRKEIRSKNILLDKTINKILKNLSDNYIVRDEYVTQRDGRMVMPVKAEYKRHVKGFIHSESATGQTVYIEPEETLELNNDILSLSFAENREIENILRELTAFIGKYNTELRKSLEAITRIDSIFARAKYSLEMMGEFPTFDEKKPINIIQLRHPILLKKLGKENTIPLDIKIEKDNVILITGPNAGGKTVVLKSFALSVAMVQSGIHIPLHADSNLCFFDNILIDIGDEQSIEDDLSTFSSHLTNIKKILDAANKKSLVLIDEIGTGTDPSEGAALALATLLSLQKKGALILATTHHGNLKIAAENLEGFQNASMEFDLKKLIPTYRFKQGIPGSSYAFEVAERIGLNQNFLDLARKNLDKEKNKVEEFLIKLEENSHKLENKLRKSELENLRLKGLSKLYENKIETLNKKKSDIIEKVRIEADKYLSGVNKEIETTIKNIKESNAQKEVIKEAKKKIEIIKKTNIELEEKSKPQVKKEKGKLTVGAYAKVEGTSTSGEIIEINDTKNRAVLLSGSLKLQVKLSKLILDKKPKDEKSDGGNYFYHSFTPSSRLDIRGLKPEEAEFDIIKFLDEAYSANLPNVEIIHGKGNGVLKKTVHSILEKNSYVKNYYFAKIEMGGEGLTIVEL